MINNIRAIETEYAAFFEEIKNKIRAAQLAAAVGTNQTLTKLYFDIGKSILEKEREKSWGSKVIASMAESLRKEFPGSTGYSLTNLFRMKKFAATYEEREMAPFYLYTVGS